MRINENAYTICVYYTSIVYINGNNSYILMLHHEKSEKLQNTKEE